MTICILDLSFNLIDDTATGGWQLAARCQSPAASRNIFEINKNS